MKQESQTNLLLGIGAITVAVIAGYFGLDYFSEQKSAKAAPATTVEQTATGDAASGDYSAAIASATAESAGGTGLTAAEAKRIGEEVARQVAAQVAQSIVDQKMGGGGGGGAGGLTEAEARRIGEEEGRRVAQEVAAATIQQALASSGGGSSAGGLSAAEAEQIGLAAGRRAAQQVAAKAAREVVRNEFGGTVTAQAQPAAASEAEAPAAEPTETASAEPTKQPSSTRTPTAATGAKLAGADALSAWWTPPASGDFGLVYAGQPKGEGAIALLFSDKPDDAALGQAVKVYDEKGTLVSGSWEAAANPRLAVLRGLQPGRYTVVVDKGLADASGKALAKAQHGPIYVI